jgi:hypothetical protein
MRGTVRRELPGLSAAALNISGPRDAGTFRLVTWVLSLLSVMFVPSIIDNLYLLVRRGGRRSNPGSSAGSLAR